MSRTHGAQPSPPHPHVEPLEPRQLFTAGAGVTYYDNVDFTGASVSRIDPTINFNWGSAAPASGIGSDTFSARWTATVEPKYSQTYTFRATTDDGVRLWVNGQKLIDKWVKRVATTDAASISLQAGQRYALVMEYYENTGSAVAKLEWSSASQPRQVVPATSLGTTKVYPGERWLDQDGSFIRAHGAGMLYRNGVYYWYGERRDGPTTFPRGDDRPDQGFSGISVYTSTDLMNWKYGGNALPPVSDASSDLHSSKIVERPKVLYNAATNRYVMWMHIEDPMRTLNRVGVAVSSSPLGPFTYQGSFRPRDRDSRDLTLFQDDDGKGYLIFATDRNDALRIVQLSSDYRTTSGNSIQLMTTSDKREAPALFKANGKYFLLTSGATGWDPNGTKYAVADRVTGPYVQQSHNPFSGTGAATSYRSQPAYVLPVAGKANAFIYVGDRWNTQDLGDSRYVWSPLRVAGTRITIDSPQPWDLSTFG